MPPYFLDQKLAGQLTSLSQRARVLSEPWVESFGYCPSCGADLRRFANNRPVADLDCVKCNEEFELKSKIGNFGSSVADGAYATKIERLRSKTNPSLLLLSYGRSDSRVLELIVIPKFFFTPKVVRERRPLSATARRAGWIGSTIRIDEIPSIGKIPLILEGELRAKKDVLEQWASTSFLQHAEASERRQWLVDTLRSVEEIGKTEFSLSEVYESASHLQKLHPQNQHIRAKLRQQLQLLRNRGLIEFLGNGKYRMKSNMT